jgi:exopolyphosphatase/guanosine-5'-triphosphate,3'-diphosphate pyrophosphatase
MTDPIRRNIANQITSQIIPRWEWRTFGTEFPETENILSSLECSRVKISEEVYILSKNSNENCKIRNSLMDIKVLEQVGDDGLE